MRLGAWTLFLASAHAAVRTSGSSAKFPHLLSETSHSLLSQADATSESTGLLPLVETTAGTVVTDLGDLTGNLTAIASNTTSTASTGIPLNVSLVNNSTEDVVYAFVTGVTLEGALFFLRADGKTLYNPTPDSASSTPVNVSEDIAIKLPPPGQSLNITIPTRFNGGRIWLSYKQPLTWQVTPDARLVEPNTADRHNTNHDIEWGFCELTYNMDQLYVNISMVDFIAMSISIILDSPTLGRHSVGGLPKNTRLEDVSAALKNQSDLDKQAWDKLAVYSPTNSSQILRILSPASYLNIDSTAFNGYFDAYVDAVWAYLQSNALIVNTQNDFGNVEGKVGPAGTTLDFFNPNITQSANVTSSYNLTSYHFVKRSNSSILVPSGVVASFAKPNTADIFTCDSGPFANTQTEPIPLAILPRLAAAFNRATFMVPNNNGTNGLVQPDGVPVAEFYPMTPSAVGTGGQGVMNHYARILHGLEVDGKGYAFPYDDVTGDGVNEVSGAVNAPDPQLLTVVVGGMY